MLILACVCAGGGFAFAQQQIVADAAPPVAAVPAPSPQKPPIHFQVLKTWKADVGDHSIIYNWVAPPVIPAPTPRPAPAPMSPEMLQWIQARERKNYQCVSIGATVYDRQYTDLHWSENGKSYRAFSNIDFNYFCGVGELETSDTIYSYFMSIGNASSESLTQGNNAMFNGLEQARQQLINLSLSPNSRSAYIMVEGSVSDTTMTAALDAMHAYYDANHEKMIQDYQQRMAAYSAQQQWAKDHPPVPKDTVINFWPKKSSTNPAP